MGTMNVTHLGQDMTERTIRISQRKKLREETKNEIVRDTRELLNLFERNAQLYQALGLHQYTSEAQMRQMANEMTSNLPKINTKIDGIKLLLAELDKLEASNG